MVLPKEDYPVLYCGKSNTTLAIFAINAERSFTLKTIRVEPLTHQENDYTNWLASLKIALQKLRHHQPSSNGKPLIIIAGQQTLARALFVPTIHPKRQALAVAYETAKALPYSIADAEWEAQFVMGDAVEKVAVLAAIPKEQARLFYQTIIEQRWQPQAILPESILYYNAFHYAFPDYNDSGILLSADTRAAYYCFISNNGFHIRSLFFKEDKAERCLSQIKTELYRSLSLFCQEHSSFSPKKIWVISNTDLFTELQSSLSVEFNAAVVALDPLSFLRSSINCASICPTLLATLLGAAVTIHNTNKDCSSTLPGSLSQIQKNGKQRRYLSLNLLPKKIQSQKQFNRRKPFLIVSLLLLASAWAIASVKAQKELETLNAQIKHNALKIEPLEKLYREIAPLNKELDQALYANAQLNQLAQRKYQWVQFFQELQTQLLSIGDTWIESVSIVENTPINKETNEAINSESAHAQENKNDRVPAIAKTKEDKPNGITLEITGYVIDRNNPSSSASSTMEQKTIRLFQALATSSFIKKVRDEKMDTSQRGLLQFEVRVDTTLSVQTKASSDPFYTETISLSPYIM